MRRIVIAASALLLIPALALAGKTVNEGTLSARIKSTFDPAKASKSKDRLRPAAITFDLFSESNDGSRLPELQNVIVNLGGPRFFFKAFPACDESDAAGQGDGVCPDGSRVGQGTGVAEVHGDPNDPSKDTILELDVKVYNGALDTDVNGNPMDPRPGLLLYTQLGDDPIVFPFWGEKRGRQVALRGPDEDPDPGVDSLFSIKEIHLRIDRRSVRRNGKRIPFLGLPTRCENKWIVSASLEPYGTDPLRPTHKVRCTDA